MARNLMTMQAERNQAKRLMTERIRQKKKDIQEDKAFLKKLSQRKGLMRMSPTTPVMAFMTGADMASDKAELRELKRQQRKM